MPLLRSILLAGVLAVIAAPSFPAVAPAALAAQRSDDLASRIDALAGHPDDPQLPAGALGASDEALRDTSSREIADLLQAGIPFAREQMQDPRLAFALGRAALAHGYARQGRELLRQAADAGSPGAPAYLGYDLLEEGERDAAADLLRRAIQRGFDSARARETLAELEAAGERKEVGSARFRASDFNRPRWIQALYDGDTQVIEEAGLVGLMYASSLQNTLWDLYMIWLSEDPAMFLELDAHLGYTLGLKLASSDPAMDQTVQLGAGTLLDSLGAMARARKEGAGMAGELGGMMSAGLERMEPTAVASAQAEQDGRRLAILYRTDPRAFRRIYQGLREFAHGADGPPQPEVGKSPTSGVERRSPERAPRKPEEVDPISLYEQLNRDSEEPVPVLFRAEDGDAFILGTEPTSSSFRIEPIPLGKLKRMARSGRAASSAYARAPGVLFALDAYPRPFRGVDELMEALESSPMRPSWHPEGKVAPMVPKVELHVNAVRQAAPNDAPFFFCAEPDSERVMLAFGRGMIDVVYVQRLRDHLACVDAVIAKTGSFFGTPRDQHLEEMQSANMVAWNAMRRWKDLFPDLEAFVEAAARAEVRPELFK